MVPWVLNKDKRFNTIYTPEKVKLLVIILYCTMLFDPFFTDPMALSSALVASLMLEGLSAWNLIWLIFSQSELSFQKSQGNLKNLKVNLK